MSRRNPMNERYGKHTAPSGKTRKSAASAKPKRSGAAQGGAAAKRPASAASKRRPLVIHPQTPEYKRWRRIWWVFLGGAIVLSTLAWWLWRDPKLQTLGNWVLGGGYALIFAAIGIDWLRLRPLRQEWARTHGADGSVRKAAKSAKESDKASDAGDVS